MEDGNAGEHQFLWQIENFSACTEDTMPFISSPVIEATSLDDSLWKVVMVPRSETDDRYMILCLGRDMIDNGPTDLQITLEFCLIDRYGRNRFKLLFPRSVFPRESDTGLLEYVRRSDIFEDRDALLPNDVLTLQCHVRRYNRGECKATRSVMSTKIHVERSTFLWTIRGLTRPASSRDRAIHIKSSVALNGMELGCKWDNTTNEQIAAGRELVLRLAVIPKSDPEYRIFMSATIQAVDRLRRKPVHEIKAEHFFETDSVDTWHLPSFVLSDELESLLEGDQLDLSCELSISDGSEDTQTTKTLIPLADKFRAKENTLQQDIRCVYEGAINADILLKAYNGLEHFWAHTMILSTRSSVFRTILNHFGFEKDRWFQATGIDANIPASSGKVVVGDETITVSVMYGMDYAQVAHVDTYVLGQMLQCMYTDTLKPVSLSNGMKLYSAGVRFDFRQLWEKSEVYLKDQISLNSLYLILVFAHSNCIAGLKRECLNFISEDWVSIFTSDEWVMFREGHEDLAMEVVNFFQSEENNCWY